MTYVIVEACIGVKDRACVDVCPVDCIYEGEDQLYIHPDECIDCGACEPECPVTAIFPEEDVPAEHAGVHREEQRGLQQRHPAGAAEAVDCRRIAMDTRQRARLDRDASLSSAHSSARARPFLPFVRD